MAAQDCPKCSAPLPLGEIGSVATCPYCHTQSRILDPSADAHPPSAQAPVQIHAKPPVFVAPPKPHTPSGAIIMAVLLVLVGVVAVALVVSVASPDESDPLESIVGPSRLRASELATYEGRGWTAVEQTGMVGTPASFDVIANFPWALGLARRWSPDARIESLYVDGLRPDGALDLSTREDWYADYRFYSPARRAAAARMREVSEATVKTEMRIQVQAGEAKVMVDTDSDLEAGPPDEVPACPLGRVLEAWRPSLPRRPTYAIAMSHHDERDRGWAWFLNMPGVSVTPSFVSADTCAGLP